LDLRRQLARCAAAARALFGLVAGVLLSASTGFAQPQSAGCAVGQYRVVELPLRPAAINDAGQVAGTTASHRAALWTRAGGLRELPLPAGFEHAEAVAINSRGHVLGMAYDHSFIRHQAFLFADDALRVLPGDLGAQQPGGQATWMRLPVAREYGVGDRRPDGRDARLADAGRRLGRRHDVHLDLRHFVHAQAPDSC
jgi:hypothetical protein